MTRKQMELLFQGQRDAVFFAEEGAIVFQNTSFQNQFPTVEVGKPLKGFLPADFASTQEELVRLNMEYQGDSYGVTVVTVEQLQVFTLVPKRKIPPREVQILENLCSFVRQKLTVLGMSLGQLNWEEGQGQAEEVLEVLSKTHYQLRRLCDNADSFARLKQGLSRLMREEIDFVAFLENLVSLINNLRGKEAEPIVFVSELACLNVFADKAKLERGLLNLLTNSLEAVKNGGSVRLELTRQGLDALLYIKDSGSGIDQEEALSLFEAYGRSALEAGLLGGGLGLGLSIAEEIVKLHGGTLLVSGGRDKGMIITIRLPTFPTEALEEDMLLQTPVIYREAGSEIQGVLTQLSELLENKVYNPKYFD